MIGMSFEYIGDMRRQELECPDRPERSAPGSSEQWYMNANRVLSNAVRQ